jgi:phosphate-selective porin
MATPKNQGSRGNGCAGRLLPILVFGVSTDPALAQENVAAPGAAESVADPSRIDATANDARAPEAPLDEPAAVGWTLAPPKVSGYLQVHYRRAFATGEDPNVDYDDFRVQRARLRIDGYVLPWLLYQVEVDPRAPEVTGFLRDAYVGLKVVPRHVIRVGQQKPHFGYENVVSSTKLYAVNRSELSDSLSRGGVTLRDVGIGLIGNVKLGSGVRIEEGITLVNGSGMNRQADDTKRKNLWGRIGLRYKADGPDGIVMRAGVSGARGDELDEGDDPDDPADDFRSAFNRVGTDVEIDQRWVFFSAEFVNSWDEDTRTGEVSQTHGYYLNLVGKTPLRAGPIVRYDTLGDEFKRWTFGAFYGLPREPFRAMLNYEYRQLRDDVRADDKFYVWLQVAF